MYKLCRNLFLLLPVLLGGYTHAIANDGKAMMLPPPGPYISSKPWLMQPGMPVVDTVVPKAEPLPVPIRDAHEFHHVPPGMTGPYHHGGWRW